METAVNTIATEIAKTVSKEIMNQVKSGDFIGSIIGANGIFHPNLNKEFWLGNYKITLSIKS